MHFCMIVDQSNLIPVQQCMHKPAGPCIGNHVLKSSKPLRSAKGISSVSIPTCLTTVVKMHMRCLWLQGQQSINPYQLYYTNTNIDPDGIGDNYIAYNKPYGIMSWLQDVNPAGDYFLIVDADMTFHRYFFVWSCIDFARYLLTMI